MTNLEKFKEVFGIPMDSRIELTGDICEVIDCDGILNCTQCPIFEKGISGFDFWEREYEEK